VKQEEGIPEQAQCDTRGRRQEGERQQQTKRKHAVRGTVLNQEDPVKVSIRRLIKQDLTDIL